MTNKKILKKQIIYRATRRGSKEMDLLLGNFVKEHIDKFSVNELKDLAKLLNHSENKFFDVSSESFLKIVD